MATIGSIVVNVAANATPFTKGMGKARGELTAFGKTIPQAKTGIAALDNGLNNLTARAASVIAPFQRMGSAVGGAVSGIRQRMAAMSAAAGPAAAGMSGVSKAILAIRLGAMAAPPAVAALTTSLLALGAVTIVGIVVAAIAALAAAAAGAVAGLAALTKGAFGTINAAADVASKLGATTQEILSLRYAAEIAGISAGTLDTALQRMVRRVSEASHGTGEAAGAIKELGLNAKELSTLTPEQQLHRIADAMVNVANEGDRVRLAMKLFDSEGVALVNMLKDGSIGVKELQAEFDRLHGRISGLDVELIKEANAAITRMKTALKGVGAQIAIAIAPAVEMFASAIAEAVADARRGSGVIMTALKGVGMMIDAVAIAWRAMKVAFSMMLIPVTKGIAILFDGFTVLGKVIQWVINQIPGMKATFADTIEESADFLHNFSDALSEEMQKALTEPLPSSKIKKAYEEARKAAEEGAGGGVGGVDESQANLLLSIAELESKLQEQIDTWGMTAHEIEIYRKAQQGATEADLAGARAKAATLEAMKRQDAITESIQRLEDEAGGSDDHQAMDAVSASARRGNGSRPTRGRSGHRQKRRHRTSARPGASHRADRREVPRAGGNHRHDRATGGNLQAGNGRGEPSRHREAKARGRVGHRSGGGGAKAPRPGGSCSACLRGDADTDGKVPRGA